ncbi:orotidine 5 -phosphate [Cystoisospora suis]|uniref:Orotidine 5'-phosphate decarboxylase n=1 Tax=Cystoisospora suis TaxID=483139 RepID=A0A2C6KNQ6_9APIC|nr:orotidine 5 -phosphate [Cystoisospora suis]
MGRDAIQPFLSYRNKGTFVLVKTSNKSSNELQALPVLPDATGSADSMSTVPLYVQVAALCNNVAREFVQEDTSSPLTSGTLRHNAAGGGVGLVVGATDTEALRQVRKACPDLWILAPGVGAQGGDLSAALQAGLCKDGKGMIIPISRGISRAQDMGAQANSYREQINAVRRQVVEGMEV